MHSEEQDHYRDWEDEGDELPSKSELKRRMRDLQSLADALTKLKRDELAQFDLPESFIESIETAARLKSSNARNRQLRHASKLLDKCGDESIEQLNNFFEERQKRAESNVHRHKTIEFWRDRLIADQKKALQNLFDEFPEANRQEVRTLARLAAKEHSQGKPPTQQRRLFCYLRDNIVI